MAAAPASETQTPRHRGTVEARRPAVAPASGPGDIAGQGTPPPLPRQGEENWTRGRMTRTGTHTCGTNHRASGADAPGGDKRGGPGTGLRSTRGARSGEETPAASARLPHPWGVTVARARLAGRSTRRRKSGTDSTLTTRQATTFTSPPTPPTWTTVATSRCSGTSQGSGAPRSGGVRSGASLRTQGATPTSTSALGNRRQKLRPMSGGTPECGWPSLN